MSPGPGDLSTSPKVGNSITFYTSSFVIAFLATLKIYIMPSEVSQTAIHEGEVGTKYWYETGSRIYGTTRGIQPMFCDNCKCK